MGPQRSCSDAKDGSLRALTDAILREPAFIVFAELPLAGDKPAYRYLLPRIDAKREACSGLAATRSTAPPLLADKNEGYDLAVPRC